MIKAIIFDCFGVLIGKGFDQTYRTAGGDPIRDQAFIKNALGQANLGLMSVSELRTTMARQLGISPAGWDAAIQEAELLNTDLLAYIGQLRVSYKTAILSNATKGSLDRKIGKQWLQKDFDEIVVSAEIGMTKPDPRVYRLVVDRLGVTPSECLYIDNRDSFLAPAHELGMSVLLYENFSRLKQDIGKLLG